MKRSVQACLILALVCSTALAWAEPLYPVALMNWLVEGTSYALIVDKSQQRLSVWRVRNGEPALVESFRCSTGESDGDKWARGDMKTPEGVYFFCSVIDGRTLPSKYGLWAFTTDYPNFVDRRRGKGGDGIWLHGRDKPLGPKPDSNGCIAMENQDLLRVSRYVRLQSTPLVVVKKLAMAPRSTILAQERAVRDFIEGWRQAWESKDLDAYMSRYSPNFQSCWLDHRAWKEKKARLNKQYKSIRVKLGDVHIYRQNGLVTAIFVQSYESDGYQCSGIKVLYLNSDDKYSIYAEDYHRPVDDPFPVGVLLASAGVDPLPKNELGTEFRIRLVSTDVPDQASRNDDERPLPSAPGRGVVLERFAESPHRAAAAVALETTEKSADTAKRDRLFVPSLMASLVSGVEIARASRPQERVATNEPPAPEPAKPQIAAHSPQPKVEARAVAAAVSQAATAGIPDKKPLDAEEFDSKLPQPSTSAKAPVDKEIMQFLARWKSAWEKKDLDRYIKMYHPDFEQGGVGCTAFRKSKRRLFAKYGDIKVKFEQVEITKAGDRVQIKFLQSFQGDDYRDKGWKSMVLVGDKAQELRILSEEWAPL